MKMNMKIIGAVAVLGACLCTGLAAEEVQLSGRWEGSLVFQPAEQEIDVVVEFVRNGGQARGRLWFPLTADGAHEIEDLAVHGAHVSFAVHDAEGVESRFAAELSPSGAGMQGTMTESGRRVPFTLGRAGAARPERTVAVQKLAADGAELKRAFNDDAGKTRMLLLLDPASFSSRMALRVVERFVMDRIGDHALRIYVVWLTPGRADREKLVQHFAALAPDPRATHFWSADRSLAAVFAPMLALYGQPSNPCLLFAPGRTWQASAPLPDRLRQSPKMGATDPVSSGQRLNGIQLAAEVRSLLAAKQSE